MGEGSPGHLSQILVWVMELKTLIAEVAGCLSHETFMLGENKGGVMFHSLVLGKGGGWQKEG